ncbi:MAG: hypothetical protein LBU89_13465 [Fibromonadaceae bacterium]|jgi:hypothetical protein|nr:hypothetical protein [Fibromonadaceae bacterium]
MKKILKIGLILLIGGIGIQTISCDPRGETDNLLSSNSNGEKSSSGLEGISQSSDSVEGSSSSIVDGSSVCNWTTYNPATHFCYLNECGRDPSCEGNLVCNDACYKVETVAEKCGGKEYDPMKEVCHDGKYIICQGQIPNCPTCREFTDCKGNPSALNANGTPMQICLGGGSPTNNCGGTTMLPKCGGKEYNPQTHFCYVNECGMHPSCRENPNLNCPTVCVREEMLTEKCDGKEYNPITHFCYVNECASPPGCRENPNGGCGSLCIREETLFEIRR